MNTNTSKSSLTRRHFLKTSLEGGLALVLGVSLSACQDGATPISLITVMTAPATSGPALSNTAGGNVAAAAATAAATPVGVATSPFEASLFLRLNPDGSALITIPKSEMGQGVRTTLAMLVAEELDLAWASVRVQQAPADSKYGNLQTGGSTSTRQLFSSLRQVGATARAMLLAAAAQKWGVPVEGLRVEKGVITNPANGQQLSYNQLFDQAAKIAPPANVKLKEPSEFKLLGTRVGRIDAPQIVQGSAIYGLDVKVPGMLYAVVARCPVIGGKLTSFDDKAVRAVPGVKQIVQIDNGVAVVADNTWAALQGREALKLNWDEGPNAGLNSAAIRQKLVEQLEKEKSAFSSNSSTDKQVEAVYELPYLAHATMEPMNCVAQVSGDSCEIWVPTQDPDGAKFAAANASGVTVSKIKVNVTLLGGGFGRRLANDYVTEAVQIAKLAGVPVKLMWTRADDMQHDQYRPTSLHAMRGTIDSTGKITGWQHRLVSPGLGAGSGGREMEVGAKPPYNVTVSARATGVSIPVPTAWWRSVAYSQNIFAVESFADELAIAAGKDPYLFRRELARSDRLKAVLELAATKANWGRPLPAGQGRGIACFGGTDYNSYVAHVAEVSSGKDGTMRVNRIICALDCGFVLNPSQVEAQLEGGIVDGLSTAFKAEITIKDGRVQQSNFQDYGWLRIDEMPQIEIYLIPSQETPGGMGEVGYPSVAPAIANAIFAATGQRLRKLPLFSNK